MPWSRPAARMREFVAAMHAIWSCWHDDVLLKFDGDFYTHTLMAPFFNPGHGGFGAPRVFLVGVGERMTEVAGEFCDGFICHPFSTERYVRKVTVPALQRGAAGGNRTLDAFEISFPTFIVTAATEEAMTAAVAGTKAQIAFYGSTPAYRTVLDLHGWGELQRDLHRLSSSGRWSEMGDAIDEEVLKAFAVVGEPEQIAPELQRRYGDCVSRLTFYTPYEPDPTAVASVRAALQPSET
jgi:probable F420-dependent oxidoreductase